MRSTRFVNAITRTRITGQVRLTVTSPRSSGPVGPQFDVSQCATHKSTDTIKFGNIRRETAQVNEPLDVFNIRTKYLIANTVVVEYVFAASGVCKMVIFRRLSVIIRFISMSLTILTDWFNFKLFFNGFWGLKPSEMYLFVRQVTQCTNTHKINILGKIIR